MSKYDGLKNAAEAATKGLWYSQIDRNERPTVFGPGTTSIMSAWHTPDGKGQANADFVAAARPEVVLLLIAENQRLDRESQNLSNQLGACDRERCAFREERDQFKAEVEILRKALTTIREESHDISACECAADALVDSRKVRS